MEIPVQIPSTLGTISNFVQRYQKFDHSVLAERFENFRSLYERLKSDFADIGGKVAESQRCLAPAFNIFRLTNPRGYEKVHSDFIAELMQPHGSHGQRVRLLTRFLEQLENKHSDFPKLSTVTTRTRWIWVQREFPTFNGQIDIVVQAFHPPMIVAIENKLGAPDQADQIPRYRHWLDTQSRCTEEGKLLVYLTKDGRKSFDAEKRGSKYLCMSYIADISGWLRSCLSEIEAPNVKEVIRQYLELIATFKEQGEDAEAK